MAAPTWPGTGAIRLEGQSETHGHTNVLRGLHYVPFRLAAMLRVFRRVLITSSEAGAVCACDRSCGGAAIALSFTASVCFTLAPRVVMVTGAAPAQLVPTFESALAQPPVATVCASFLVT